MTDYDPRTATGIPTEPVGSLPRPSRLQQAYAQYDAGQITREQLETEQDTAVRDSIEHLEKTGAPIISDGEQRWSSFAGDLPRVVLRVRLLQPIWARQRADRFGGNSCGSPRIVVGHGSWLSLLSATMRCVRERPACLIPLAGA